MCCEKFAANALYNVKNALLCLKNSFRWDLQMKVFLFKTCLFDTLYFFLKNTWGFTTSVCGLRWNQLLHCLLVAFECVSRVECITYCCLCGNEYWNGFSSCGQFSKATCIECKWSSFKKVCKFSHCVWRNNQHNRRRPLRTSSKNNIRMTEGKKVSSTFKIQKEQLTKFLWKFPTFENKKLIFSQLSFFCRINDEQKKTLSLCIRFNFYRLSVQVAFFCVKSLNCDIRRLVPPVVK